MSKSLESQVWQSALDAELKPVAAVMADMGNNDGLGIYPSVEHIAWLLSRSERSVQTALKKLVQLGILDRVANAKGGRALTPRYRLNADALPERPKWQSIRKGADIAPFSVTPKGCNERPERVQSTTQKGANSAPDPLVEPLVIQEPPLPPKRKQSHKPPEPPIEIALPYQSEAFREALELYEKHKREVGKGITPTNRDELYRTLLQCGSEEIAIDSLRTSVRNGWKGVFPEKLNGNGNGHKKFEQEYTGPVKSKPNPKLENCPDCGGMGNVLVEVNGVKYAKVCKHERSEVAVA